MLAINTNIRKYMGKNQDVDKNETADHCWKNDHEMNWEEQKVIDAKPSIKLFIHLISILFYPFLSL